MLNRHTRYRHKSVDVFDWRNISNVTESVPIEDITYVDLHPQPTHDPDMMPTILKVGVFCRCLLLLLWLTPSCESRIIFIDM